MNQNQQYCQTYNYFNIVAIWNMYNRFRYFTNISIHMVVCE